MTNFNRGFILIEYLVAIVIFSMIVILIFQQQLIIKSHSKDDYSMLNDIVLTSKMSDDFLYYKSINITNKKIDITNYNSEVINYEIDKNRIVRKVNNKGYEIISEGYELNFLIDENKLWVAQNDEKKTFVAYI